MREVTLLVESSAMPDARQITKLEKKSLVSNIYIGKPKAQYAATYGTEPRVQLNDKIARVEDIGEFVMNEKSARKEEDQNMITNNLKIHMDTKMGIIIDVKQELRKANSLRVSYATRKKL